MIIVTNDNNNDDDDNNNKNNNNINNSNNSSRGGIGRSNTGSISSKQVLFFFYLSGLWMADLVVAQLFQENVPEHQRGMINGVQNSINQLLDMTKFILVIILPKLHTFGFLILLSFTFIFFGNVLFWVQAFRSSGHSVSRCLRGHTTPPAKADTIEKEVPVAEESMALTDNGKADV